MNTLRLFTLLVGVLFASTDAFVTTSRQGGCAIGACQPLKAAVALEPEPEGGKELTAITSMPGCRIKEMKELSAKSDLGTPYQFWMTAEVDATLIKEIRTQILKDASKKANFPGFRKVCGCNVS